MKEEASLVIEKQPMELSVESVDTQEDMSSLKEDFVVVESVDKSTPASKSPTVLNSSLHATAPEFVPKAAQQSQQQKKSTKKYLTREQLIEQQRQHHIPKSKARCSHWPHCTNNNCKFFHPYRACRAGDDCMFGDRCMFVHPNDCVVPVRENNHQKTKSSNNNTATKNNTAASSVTV
ncbi:uncharacterized protein B0P05DRAFT_523871, partial [Gilbertella persicaria]|uniref:uncharacterized protein n=1 Tax=Gilbertella persicaria TaxID=101096 RepID=UPI002220E4C9